ncbi:hypothetical protein ACA910_020575 [Epithemia clementina (nom. ined.)]
MSSSSNNSSSNNEEDEPLWLISVKTVGAERQAPVGTDGGSSHNTTIIPSSFDVRVKPSDNIQSLHARIENVTGLKESQQRLIYRGRLIQSNYSTTTNSAKKKKTAAGASSDEDDDDNNDDQQEQHQQQVDDDNNTTREPTKISEIKGLADGHTIHLVRRQEVASNAQDHSPNSDSASTSTTTGMTAASTTTGTAPSSSAAAAAAAVSSENESNNSDSSGGSSSSSSSTATSSLLAALLGLSAFEEDADEGGATRSSWRRSRRSRPSYRLTAEDLEVPDPGSMESVRQGLLTLHTLLPIAEQSNTDAATSNNNNNNNNQNNTTTTSSRNPLEHHRRWYLGQWIDCRDTVNQWLEATIVDIKRPEEILPTPTYAPSNSNNHNPTPTIQPAMDPAVGAGDLEGRRRLLLEPCPAGEPGDLGGDLAGYRPRPSNRNNNVSLLLIHYNGWPHRWDEWIRSDSERIRPFRVRTRHPTSSSFISPTTQSHYADSPPTFLGGAESNDVQDRSLLLHELVRVSTAVNALAQRAAEALPPPSIASSSSSSSTVPSQPDLPWRILGSAPEEDEGTVNVSSVETHQETRERPDHSSPNRPDPRLDMLATLIDRLGRTLVDAAPHIASLAASQNRNRLMEENDDLAAFGSMDTTTTEDGNDNLPRGSNDAAAAPTNNNTSTTNGNNNPSSLGGLLSLLNRERSRRSSRTSQQTDQALSPVIEGTTAVAASTMVDPDYMDFASGLVNVSRGDVRAGPRSSRGSSSGGRDEISGLLGAYLAAASLGGLAASLGGGGGDGEDDLMPAGLGRLFRSGNNNNNGENNNNGGGGIDIHIHAVVTAPGMSPVGGTGGTLALGLGGGGLGGGLGPLGTVMTGTTTTASPDLFANTRRATAQRLRATLMEQNQNYANNNNDDDLGIFDDLYSENPDPVSPTTTTSPTATNGNDLGSNNSSNHSNNNNNGAAGTASLRSSSLRRSSRRPNNNNNNNSSSSNSNIHNSGGSSNRTSFFGRLFRRNGASE